MRASVTEANGKEAKEILKPPFTTDRDPGDEQPDVEEEPVPDQFVRGYN